MKVVYFLKADRDLHPVEFGHSELSGPKTVGPYVRNTYILHYVLNGTCHFDGFEAHKGEAFIISKNRLHSFSVDAGYKHLWLAFDGDNAADLLKSFNIDPYQHSRLMVSDPDFADRLAENAKAHILSSDDMLTAKSWLYAMLPLTFAIKTPAPSARPDILTAVSFMEQHYEHPLNMQQIADILHISEKHFCKLFRKQYGIPPQKFLINIRMEAAKQLLRSTDLKIKEVAGSVGYASQLVFSSAFKSHYHLSPTEYRDKQKTR